jgi:hypothetical protein
MHRSTEWKRGAERVVGPVRQSGLGVSGLFFALFFGLLLLLVSPGLGLAQSESLDSVDVGSSDSLDSVDDGASGTPEGNRLADSDSLDSADTGESDSLDAEEQTYGNSLDSVPLGTSSAPDNANLVWRPTPCSQLATPSVEMPETSNATSWVRVLNQTRADIAAAKQQLDEATVAFGQTNYQPNITPATRVPLGEARDAARRNYSEQLCKMPYLLDAARQAGVDPGVLRPYQTANN